MKLIAAILALSLTATPALANDRLADCEQLLDQADHVINVQADTIQQLDAQRSRLEKELDYTMSELAKEKAWYRDTSIVAPLMFIIGVTAGAYTMKQLQ